MGVRGLNPNASARVIIIAKGGKKLRQTVFVNFKVEDVVVTVPFPKQVLNVNLTPSGIVQK